MRIVFAGSPDIAVPALEALEKEHEIVAVLTNPDSTRGRGRNGCVTQVKEIALEYGLQIIQPDKLNSEVRDVIAALKPDILVAVAYGKIFGPKFLALFPMGGLNLHPSLLPLYRGCSPVNTAILNGDSQTGVTIQRLALKMDSGDILMQENLPLAGDETAGRLLNICADLGAGLLVKTLKGLEEGSLKGITQNEADVSYCSFINKKDGEISWEKSAVEIERMFRAYQPWPGIYTSFRGHKLNILEISLYTEKASSDDEVPGRVLGVEKNKGILIQTGDGILLVSRLQLQAKKPLDFSSFINGNRDFTGSVLGG